MKNIIKFIFQSFIWNQYFNYIEVLRFQIHKYEVKKIKHI